jgi:FkbM family methyltransferase
MIDFSVIRRDTPLGTLLRMPLRLFPTGAAVPILQGPLRGKRWILGSSNNGCWLGTYELSKQTAMLGYVQPGMVCYDVGANVGFYTLLFSYLAPNGRVVAFEPLGRNATLLRRHIELNHRENVTVLENAVADYDGTARFQEAPSPSMGYLSEQGNLAVGCRKLDSLIGAGLPPPGLIKVDVEGAEGAVLAGAAETIRKYSPIIFLATHGRQQHNKCIALLKKYGYSAEGLTGEAADRTDELLASRRTRTGRAGQSAR